VGLGRVRIGGAGENLGKPAGPEGSWCPWVFPRLFLCSLPSACVLLLLELFLTSHPEVGGGRSGTMEAAPLQRLCRQTASGAKTPPHWPVMAGEGPVMRK
jgi:hypothetical protein